MLGTGTGRKQKLPTGGQGEAAKMVRLGIAARGHLRAKQLRAYRRALNEIRPIAARLGATVVDHRDLMGMVVGLEYPDRPGPRHWVFIA